MRRLAGLLVCLVAVIMAASARADPQDGQRAYDWGHYDDARRIWLPAAEAGDPVAEFGMGLLYDVGRAVPQNAATAYDWYLRAARAGLPAAEFNVGVMNDSGYGVPENSAAAALWYARAAARGNTRAAYNLGQLYAAGEGVPKNPAVARVWFAMAAQDLPAAAARLAAPIAPPGASTGALASPVAQTPALSVAASETTAELVWSAPPEPGQVRYAYTIVGLDRAGPHIVASDTLDRSATLVRLTETFPTYAWRVYAVSDSTAHYAASAWQRFSANP